MPRGSDPTPRPPDAPASEAVDRFIEAWGRMGSVWGISRTMAEVHALLYITGAPMCTDDVMQRLQISRGNASMSLRALLDWGVVTRVHRRGDRKEYYQAEQDVWSAFRAIVRERMKREIDPLLVNLHEIRDHSRTAEAGAPDPDIDKRLDAMIDFFEMTTRLGNRFIGPTGTGLKLAATLLSRTPGGPKPRPDTPGNTPKVRSDAG
jgi:DNA-binding transcriptional regulator GbsR (MarR family)